MKRFALLLTCAVMLAGSGCCCHQQPCGNPCGPCGYGAGYSPTMMPYGGGGCPNGACGTYPGAYIGSPTTAYAPYTTTAAVDPLPAY